MKIEEMKVIQHKALTKDVYKIILQGALVKQITNSGQFVQIKIEGKYLRRPISIADFNQEEQTLTLIYKILGEGTAILSTTEVGSVVDCLGPLGNGFDVARAATYDNILVCGGGVGIPPLYSLVKTLKMLYPEKQITMIAGSKTETDIFYLEEFSALTKTYYVTDDGSYNPPARNVVEAAKEVSAVDYLFACGPTGMLKALDRAFPDVEKQLSLEEHMACGVGLCMGCVYPTDDGGYIRICKEGPIIIKQAQNEEGKYE